MRNVILWFSIMVGGVAYSSDELFSVIRKAEKPLISGQKVYVGETADVHVSNMKLLESSNYWAVRLPHFLGIKRELAKLGTIHAYVDGDFAVIETSEHNEQKLAELAHNKNGACGALVKLNRNFVSSDINAENVPTPIYPVKSKLEIASALSAEVNHENIASTILKLERMGTRYHKSETGIATPSKVAGFYKSIIPEDRNDIKVTLKDVKDSPQDNVIIRIEGKTRPDEVIVLGSHIDSIAGWRGSGQAPGADDDASGTATNLEIFRVLMAAGIKPDRTIEIHGYAAEEIGLVGSIDLANFYLRHKKNVVAMVQMDMNLYSGRRSKLDKMWFVSNGTNEKLTGDLMSIASDYLGVEPIASRLSGGTSDHQSWHQRKFAAAFPFENPRDYNSKIHTPNDRLSSVGDAKFSALYAKLGLIYVLHYAGF